MYWVALGYITGMVAFCLFGKYGNVPWAIQYYVFTHGMISFLAFALRTKLIGKGVRRVFGVLGFFALFFAIYFAAASLQCKSVDDFLDYVDSPLWSLMAAVIALILLIGYFYDKTPRNSIN